MEECNLKFKILIAEDAPVQGKKLQYVLEKFGYDVVWALDGQLALNELEKDKFSLIITDYQMPNLDGLEFLKKVRAHEKFHNIPIILLTTIEDEMVFLESLEAGANEFLNKPFRPEELKLRVKNLISLYHYQMVLDEDNKELNLRVHEQNELLKLHIKDLNKAHEELKSMQEQMVINSKMASLGVMSAGVAHEINNPLAIIKMYNHKLKSTLDKNEFDRDRLLSMAQNIDKNTERINNIVIHLKKFSQTENVDGVHENATRVDLARSLIDLKDFYGGLIAKYNIELKTNYEDNLFVNISPTLLEQVVINLIHNAVDAIETVPDKKIEIKSFKEGDWINVQIVDNGPGIPKNIQDKIFDPFFTTKDPGKGTGLGLSLVKTYLKSADGEITVNSEPGRTSFNVKLKAVQ